MSADKTARISEKSGERVSHGTPTQAGGVRKFLKDIYYATRLPFFFLAFLDTMLGWLVAAVLVEGFDLNTLFVSMRTTFYLIRRGIPAGVFFTLPFCLEFYQGLFAGISNGICFTAILMFNDYCDYESDIKGRRRDTMLTRGEITKSEQLVWVLTLMVACLAISIFLVRNLTFLLLTLVAFLGGWLYSARLPPERKVPPRAKERPVFGVLFNGLFSGGLPIMGAILVTSELSQLPYLLFVACALAGMGAFVSGCVMDIEDDRKEGLNTIAVRLGFKKSVILSEALCFGFIVPWGVMAYFNYLLTFKSFLYLVLPAFLIGSLVTYIGFFKHVANLKTQRVNPAPARLRKAYKYLFVGSLLQTLPLSLCLIDYLIVDFIPL
jgi:4-hydroxybenzoate polyprenyltransferase